MKRLKLRKEVKFITCLLCFALLLGFLPTMNVIAEDQNDETVTTYINSEFSDEVSVGPYVKYEPSSNNITPSRASTYSLKARSTFSTPSNSTEDDLVINNGAMNEDGSITYENGIKVDKTIETANLNDTQGNVVSDAYKLNMTAEAASNIIEINKGVDFILLLDMSKYMATSGGTDRLSALKGAVTKFINTVAEKAPDSRIALVSYSDNSSVLSGSKVANDGALVTLNAQGKESLIQIVNRNLNNPSGNSNCDMAMLDSLKIFQDANSNVNKDKTGTMYKDRTRVSILFTAGIPGNGINNDHYTGWDVNARNVAQASMSLSVILKGDRFETITPPDNSNVAGGDKWEQLKGTYVGLGLEYEGCKATMYTVGLNLPEAAYPLSETGNQVETFDSIAETAYDKDKKTYSAKLKQEYYKAALVNEYLYRVSQHRPTGEHLTISSDGDVVGVNKIENSFAYCYNNLPTISKKIGHKNYTFNMKDLFYNGQLYFLYPDKLTRDLENGYYLTATDTNIAKLTEIFEKIAQQTGESIENLTIRDYIDPSFEVINENGGVLNVGEKVTSGTSEGTLCQDENGLYYIEWNEVELSPQSADGKVEAKTFNQSIYVRLKDSSFGGNQAYTNISGLSGVYTTKTSVYPFPVPSVDIPIKFTLQTNNQSIYLSQSADLTKCISTDGIDGINNRYVDITYTIKDGDNVIATLNIPARTVVSEVEWSSSNLRMNLTKDKTYTVEVEVASACNSCNENASAHHIHNEVTPKTIPGKAQIYVYKPEVTFADKDVYYGDKVGTLGPDSIVWKHTDADDKYTIADEKELGSAPIITFTYLSGESQINSESFVNSKSDIVVDVDSYIDGNNINNNTKYIHKECSDPEKDTILDNGEFILHVKTCQLTVTKSGGESGEPYIFTLYKSNGNDYVPYSQITVIGNGSETVYELPVGTYKIVEDEGWSWRYSPACSGPITLSSSSSRGSLSCKNTKNENKSQWLNGFSIVVQNIYGQESKQKTTNG